MAVLGRGLRVTRLLGVNVDLVHTWNPSVANLDVGAFAYNPGWSGSPSAIDGGAASRRGVTRPGWTAYITHGFNDWRKVTCD